MQGVQEDIATLQGNVDNINEISKLLTDDGAAPDFCDKMQTELADLNGKWAHVLDLSSEQNRRLREALEKSHVFLESIGEMEEFVADVQANHLGREYTVHSQAELDELHDRFRVSVTGR